MKVILNKIFFSENGKRVNFDYSVEKSIQKYFDKNKPFFVEYDIDVSTVPHSILVIPFLANTAPIGWFVGFDIYVKELDRTFYNSLSELKKEFSIYFDQIKKDSELFTDLLAENKIDGNEAALLFSGGLDSFESLTRNIKKDPFLISVLGADIEIDDKKRWSDFVRFNYEEEIINKKKLHYITSNLRTFYTYRLDLLVNLSWWGKVQHGMALISLIAPLSYLNKITTVMIASSNTAEVSFGWGSTSGTDEKVKWANLKVIHDGFQFRRTDKIQNVVDFTNNTDYQLKLRVCYSELREGYNCNRCTKCQRTMLGIILSGENPNNYGFQLPNDFYDLISHNFTEYISMTVGIKYEWSCLQQKAKKAKNPFVVVNEEIEKAAITKFTNIELDKIVNTNPIQKEKLKVQKYILQSRFPKLFNLYLLIRRKIKL
jgi:hypothetical protein